MTLKSDEHIGVVMVYYDDDDQNYCSGVKR